jgi:hypothetical protein
MPRYVTVLGVSPGGPGQSGGTHFSYDAADGQIPPRKEVNRMSYQKPEIAVLGRAAEAIEQMQHLKGGMYLETSTGQLSAISPVYDLDD